MGSNPSTDPYFWGAEGPQHTVYLDAFWIYRTEVTNGMYQACVQEHACPRPAQIHSSTRSLYYGNPSYNDYPVIYVSWIHAASFCRWAGGRLPTEAEWEKAARGIDSRLFPWGNENPTEGRVNYKSSTYQDTAPVGSFPSGASPFGVMDMAGNVWEWTFDWFQPTYYSISPDNNPRGPFSGTTRVIRGGSWSKPAEAIRTVMRASLKPEETFNTLGFRCVVDE